MLSFKKSYIYWNNQKIIQSNLSIENGKFVSNQATSDAIQLPENLIIVPGFIEQHIHGANGVDTMDGTSASLHCLAHSLLQDGVTSFLPTTMTMSKQKIIHVLQTIADKPHLDDEAKIIGVHLEGPFLSPQYKGAQDPTYIVKPTIDTMQDFILASKNKIKMITLAIENANDQFLDFLAKNKIVISVGHSNANANQVDHAINHGLQNVTHTYNAMSKFHHRDIGVVGQALLNNQLSCELILDLYHVSELAAQLLFKNKPLDKLILVSDSTQARFKPDGQYQLGGLPIYVKDNQARLLDGTLAGSVLTIPQALKNAHQLFHLSIEQTIDLVAKNVAKNLNLTDLGEIKIDNWADFVIIDHNFNIYKTYVNGKEVYSK